MSLGLRTRSYFFSSFDNGAMFREAEGDLAPLLSKFVIGQKRSVKVKSNLLLVPCGILI